MVIIVVLVSEDYPRPRRGCVRGHRAWWRLRTTLLPASQGGLGGGETSEGSISCAAALAQLIQLILEWAACYTMLYMVFFGAALRIESERSSFQAAAIHIQDLQAAQSARPKTATQWWSSDPPRLPKAGGNKLGLHEGFLYVSISNSPSNSHQMDCGHRGSLHHGQLTATDPWPRKLWPERGQGREMCAHSMYCEILWKDACLRWPMVAYRSIPTSGSIE